jgi:hypothetical protein
MAILNKKRYVVYLDEENTEYVKAFIDTTKHKGGLSGLIDGYLSTMATVLKASGYKPGDKLTAAKLLKVGIRGMKQMPA